MTTVLTFQRPAGVGLMMALMLPVIMACNPVGPATETRTAVDGPSIRVTGEIQSANSINFGPPSIKNIWHYTIAYMAPDGSIVPEGKDVLRFNPEELRTKILNKSNELNETQKELQKQQIVARERLAELKLSVEEARAVRDKSKLIAEIPEDLLPARDFKENQLILEQSTVLLQLRKAEVEKETKILATETLILERNIAALQSEIDELQDSVKKMTIKAPMTGVVIHSIGKGGNKLAVGDNVWGGQRVIELPDLSLLELQLEIPERESAIIDIGQPVTFTMDAIPDKLFHGEITELASVVRTKSINQPAKVFDATVTLTNPDPELMRPGMSVNAEILIDSGP